MNSKAAAPADSSPSGSDIAEHMAPLLELFTQAVANLRALLPRLPPLAEGPTRIALEQIARARQIAENGGQLPMDLRTLPLADLAQVIRRRSEAAGMSQPQLARRAGLTLTTIKNLEKGRHRDTLGR